MNELQPDDPRQSNRRLVTRLAVVVVMMFGFGLSQLVFLYVVLNCIRDGKPAPAKPWEGADTLEWTLPSPAPYHTFETPPHIA